MVGEYLPVLAQLIDEVGCAELRDTLIPRTAWLAQGIRPHLLTRRYGVIGFIFLVDQTTIVC